MSGLAVALLLAAYAPQQAGSTPLDPAREARVQALGKQLRCPMCQGLSIADSGSSAARAQMDKVRELVAAGQSDQQIRAYFIARYGEWSLLEPPAHGMNLLVWILPGFLLLLGLLAIARVVGRRGPGAPAVDTDTDPDSTEPPAPATDPYLEAVRAELRR
jgi:cytochrome c-type biogenesis protein CcmH